MRKQYLKGTGKTLCIGEHKLPVTIGVIKTKIAYCVKNDNESHFIFCIKEGNDWNCFDIRQFEEFKDRSLFDSLLLSEVRQFINNKRFLGFHLIKMIL